MTGHELEMLAPLWPFSDVRSRLLIRLQGTNELEGGTANAAVVVTGTGRPSWVNNTTQRADGPGAGAGGSSSSSAD